MAAPFELEHWRSRALTAEKERDSARSVLARLRNFLRLHEAGEPATMAYDKLRAAQRTHDQSYWNTEHAMHAVADAIEELRDDGRLPQATPEMKE